MIQPKTEARRWRVHEYAVHEIISNHPAPSYRAIQRAIGHSSTSLVQLDLEWLSKHPDSLLELVPNGRCRRLVLRSVPPRIVVVMRLMNEIMALARVDNEIRGAVLVVMHQCEFIEQRHLAAL